MLVSPSGYVQINLTSCIQQPTSIVEIADFALLSQNILFDDGFDPSDGGPCVIQIVKGIEINHFGQQGMLGHDPIHYYLSSNAIGSKIVKNLIWESHQQCIVIHGTDNVQLVQDNIAFDTLVYCFKLEDGIETGNIFVRNLGALTWSPTKITPNNEGTDNELATFWITNPTHYFNDNVAAGSNSSGFWFELKKQDP